MSSEGGSTRNCVFVLGGAGYVGSHVTKTLLEITEDPPTVVVIDNISKGHLYNVDAAAAKLAGNGERKELSRVIFEQIDVRDTDTLAACFAKHRPCAVFNFTGSIEVGVSMQKPLEFYDNNVIGMTSILKCVVEYHVPHVIFSSTAAVYGTPDSVPIPEDAPLHPENPYGETKLASERMLHWIDKCHGVKSVSLRYFNACGADPSGQLGEDHTPESHLIPLILQVAAGKRESISVFGSDYPTADGTCVRDYVHVTDLATAHVLAWRYLQRGGDSTAFNLGTSTGYSVRQVIAAARHATGHSIPSVDAARRPGDPAALVASSQRARELLQWRPQFPDIEQIVESAWRWHQSLWAKE